MKKKEQEDIEKLIGRAGGYDVNFIDDFIEECVEIKVGKVLSSQVMFLAFQLYVLTRGGQLIIKIADFNKVVKQKFSTVTDKLKAGDYDDFAINYSNISIED